MLRMKVFVSVGNCIGVSSFARAVLRFNVEETSSAEQLQQQQQPHILSIDFV
jgi:hypothetical protein